MTTQNLVIGQSAYIEKYISEADVQTFANLSTDTNPIHLDADYAANSLFGQRIAHGYLVGSLISAVLGTQLPGPGSIYLEQSMRFLKPVYLGDTIRATVTVQEIIVGKKILKLETVCAKCVDNVWEPVITGQAIIKLA